VSTTYVLDASAVLDFIEDGPGAERIEQLFKQALGDGTPLLMSVLNWGEVFYHSWQRRGEESAKRVLADLSRLPIELVPVDLSQALKAGELKVVHKIPYVDCVAAALSLLRQSTLVTADRDFEKLGRQFPILWIFRS
jgi:predicted nucleic acid-binding protein